MSRFSRTDTSFLGQWWWTVDRHILSAICLLIILGVGLVTTASPQVAEHLNLNSYHFLFRHLIILCPTVGLLFLCSFLDHRYLWRGATILFATMIAALILVLLFGVEVKGARRWIRVLGFSLQPSEFIKPAFLILSAWLLSVQKKTENFPGLILATILYVVVSGLLLLQPDLGMTFVVTFCWGVQIFLAGLRFRLLIILILLGIGGLLGAYTAFPHVQSRVDRFLDPESGDKYQVQKSIEAFQNGGLMGTGPGQGTVKLSLPDSHADFIFSVAGEEMGLFFALMILLIYGYIIVRGYNKLMDNQHIFAVLAGGGLLTMFGLQAFIHMGSALNILPAKGMTLPLMSYGGSSLLSMGFCVGAILSLTRRGKR